MAFRRKRSRRRRSYGRRRRGRAGRRSTTGIRRGIRM